MKKQAVPQSKVPPEVDAKLKRLVCILAKWEANEHILGSRNYKAKANG